MALARPLPNNALNTAHSRVTRRAWQAARPTLVEAMLHADLLDELRLEIYPVIAGSGARLFQEGRSVKQLQLADSRITGNGVAILTYQSANNA